jgi:hypothetical protein
MFFELIVNYERAREKHFFFAENHFFYFVALNEVIRENSLHTFEALYEGNVTLKFRNFY